MYWTESLLAVIIHKKKIFWHDLLQHLGHLRYCSFFSPLPAPTTYVWIQKRHCPLDLGAGGVQKKPTRTKIQKCGAAFCILHSTMQMEKKNVPTMTDFPFKDLRTQGARVWLQSEETSYVNTCLNGKHPPTPPPSPPPPQHTHTGPLCISLEAFWKTQDSKNFMQGYARTFPFDLWEGIQHSGGTCKTLDWQRGGSTAHLSAEGQRRLSGFYSATCTCSTRSISWRR